MKFSIPILPRFLSTQFLRAFGLVFFSIIGIILLFSVIRSLAITGKDGAAIPFAVVMRLGIYEVLKTLTATLPLSVLLSGHLAFWRLSRTSELVIIRSIGISVWGFLMPIILVCMGIGIINFSIISPISAAYSQRMAHERFAHAITSHNPMVFSQTGLWLRERNEATQSFLYAESIRKEGDALKATGITIFITNSRGDFLRRVEGASGVLKNGELRLSDVETFDTRLELRILPEYVFDTSLSAEKIEESASEPDKFSFWELPSFISFFEESGFSAKKHRQYFYTLLFMPLTLVALLFVSALFSISPARSQKGLMLKLSGGVMLGFVVFFMDQVVRAIGTSGHIPLLPSSVIVPLITLIVCTTVLLHQEDG
ncbi:MAG: LptF/LptG family permease [Alphaproteobacteria bacterium]|nr:LptF/LptG family permease [Alphaproteobacteria bacterium]